MPPVKKSLPWPVRLGALAAAAALAFLPPMTLAQRRKEPPPEIPPPVQPLAVKVQRGEACEIVLRTYGRKNEPLKYLIRTPPEHGRLTAPRMVERDLSAVTYTPPADLPIGRDRFFYAVQNGAGVSAPAEVVITIVDAPPVLELPAGLDFPPILAGATLTKPLEITNRGGGLAEGRVSVEAPWKIDGSANYHLGPGARAVFRLVFAPAEVGRFDRLVRFSSQPESGVSVHGEARAALTATPANVVLQHPAGDPARTGDFELANHTGAELRVTLSATARLVVPPEIVVPSQGTAKVAVQTAGSDVAALDGEVRAEGAGLTIRVPVRAAPVGAIVRVTGERVAFGRVEATTAAGASVELENIGGTVAAATLEIAPPFLVDPAPLTLSPGEKKAVAIRTQPAAAGKYRTGLIVKAGRQKLEIPVEAELAGPTSAAAAAPAPSPRSDPTPPPADPAVQPAASPVEAERLLPMRRVAEGVKITDETATGATFSWPEKMSAAAQFRVEMLEASKGADGKLQMQWKELPGVTFRREGGSQSAVLSGLRPATVHPLRVVPLGADAEPGPPIFSCFLTTRERASFWPKVTLLRGLLAALALCAAFIVRQRLAAKRRA